MRYLITFLALALVTQHEVDARECNPTFAERSYSVTVRAVEIDARSVAVENLHLRVLNGTDVGRSPAENAGNCAAVLRISRPDAMTLPDFPAYQLRAPANPDVEILATASLGKTSRSDIILGGLPAGRQGRAVPLQIIVPTEWGLKSGFYSEQLLLSLYDESGTLRDQATANVAINIPAAVSIRIVGAVGNRGGGGARIDLGNISSTQDMRSQPFGARILSTTAYGVSFRSENSGALLNVSGSGSIPYRLFYEGKLVDLKGANFFPEPSHTPASGDVRPLQVIVPATNAKPAAGLYRDRVTVQVTAI